ncbi:MAG TPA: DNA polymerase III subunit delta' C-terminal domain-containing protein [bacterium]|nr:DNA polymerase III subunit delta' C-terminal domain-containing protein [bacterium]HPN29815.1 DNA polymerase III subunit delta' C-terminal domain-containing protein [bacterium]
MDIDFYNQKKNVNFLKQSFKLNRLAHSYIFSGPEGLGKLEIARFFINIIQCLNLNDNLEPCGECKNCIKIRQNIFVDNLEVTTAGDKTTISVDQIREEILEFARYSSNEGKYKVCLVYPAEKMRAEAMNALLKILEEPPEKFIFILITSNHFQLLSTILSRCQTLKFNPLPVKQIETRLIKYKNFEPVKARILSVLSGGRINFAIKLEESGALEKRQNILNGLSAALEKKSFFEYFNLANFLVSEMKKVKLEDSEESDSKTDKNKSAALIIEIAGSFFRDLLLYKSLNENQKILNIDYLEDIIKISQNYSYSELERFAGNSFVSERLLKSNVNPLLVFENMLDA